MIRVLANGDPVDIAEGASVDDLIVSLRLGSRWVIAELNGEPVERGDRPTTILCEGDRVELVAAVAGG